MGRVGQRVVQHVPRGEQIASSVSTDLLLAAGVSNWGGYGLAAALHVLRSCRVHSRYARRGTGLHREPRLEEFLNTVAQVGV